MIKTAYSNQKFAHFCLTQVVVVFQFTSENDSTIVCPNVASIFEILVVVISIWSAVIAVTLSNNTRFFLGSPKFTFIFRLRSFFLFFFRYFLEQKNNGK